jgi:hypothetical protein
MRQEVAGKNEERNGHDLELLDAGEQLQGHRFERYLRKQEQEAENGQAERDRDRHAGQHEAHQQDEDDCGVHCFLPPWPDCSSG